MWMYQLNVNLRDGEKTLEQLGSKVENHGDKWCHQLKWPWAITTVSGFLYVRHYGEQFSWDISLNIHGLLVR